jgi:hypothetical protein
MSGNLYRVGRKLGRTLYLQQGREPSDDDVLLGLLDDPAFAAFVADVLSENEFEYDHEAAQSEIAADALGAHAQYLRDLAAAEENPFTSLALQDAAQRADKAASGYMRRGDAQRQ